MAFALEIRREWAEAILSKSKTIELRGYRIPEQVGNSRVWLLATDGPAGEPALGDTISPWRDRGRARVVGWARFRCRRGGSEKEKEKDKDKEEEKERDDDATADEGPGQSSDDDEDVITYRSAAEVAADEGKHLVSSSSAYGWKEGATEALFGWRIDETGRVGTRDGGVDVADAGVRGRRLLRSVYRLEREPVGV